MKKYKVTISAPGKLMLFGEHAVVYNRPSIVTAVGQRMFVTAEFGSEKPLLEIKAPDVKTHLKIPLADLASKDIPKEAKFIAKAVEVYLKEFVNYKGGIKITTKSEFSSKFGFGSSSAVTVCTLKALSVMFEDDLDNRTLFDWAYKVVLDIQGKGSGFDVAAAIYGGTLYFIKGGKALKPLNIPNLPLIIGYSGIKADTVTLIDEVAKKAKKFPKVIDNLYTLMGELIPQAQKALLKGDFETVGELMDFNQGYLSSLGVSSSKLDAMINTAREAGAYGAKLSGAGVGDCMIAFAPPSKVIAVKKAINKAGGQVIDIKSNVEGVRIEQ